MSTLNPHRKNFMPWKQWEAAHVEPISDERLHEIEEAAISVLGVEPDMDDAGWNDDLARDLLGLVKRLRDAESRASWPRCPDDGAFLWHSHDGAFLCPKCERQIDAADPEYKPHWHNFANTRNVTETVTSQ